MDAIPKMKRDCYWLNKNLEKAMSNELLHEYNNVAGNFCKISWNRKIDKNQTLFQYLLEKEQKYMKEDFNGEESKYYNSNI